MCVSVIGEIFEMYDSDSDILWLTQESRNEEFKPSFHVGHNFFEKDTVGDDKVVSLEEGGTSRVQVFCATMWWQRIFLPVRLLILCKF